MILISHRGNINGPNPEMENKPEYILVALNAGFDVEVDIWYRDDKLMLGHDQPQYQISLSFLKKKADSLWVHCKNIGALQKMYENECCDIHYFWHQTDDYTLTSRGFIWTYPGKKIVPSGFSIAVLPEQVENWNCEAANGICSDYIEKWL